MKPTKLLSAATRPKEVGKGIGVFSVSQSCHPYDSQCISWTTHDFLRAHFAVRESGFYNFEGCRIPIPTSIRFDRMKAALGSEISFKELRVLDFIKYGIPINCRPNVGVKKPQKNHYSAISFKEAIDEYVNKNVLCQAMLGPFMVSPISDLSFSPLMTVPKEESKRRVIVDFSFPPGASINDGISRTTYLEFEVQFSLPSVQSMVDRLNYLGPGALMYKRDLKSAFRQFSIDPGDYVFTGVNWDNKIFIDTRLAMGLRSSAYC